MDQDHFFPKSLFGKPASVRKWWRPRARHLLRGATWAEVTSGETWINIEDVAAKFYVTRKSAIGAPQGAPTYLIASELSEQVYGVLTDREEMYQQLKRIVFSGLDQLWSAIGLLKGLIFPHGTSYDHERPQLYAQIVRGQLAHWDWYCNHEKRFDTPLDRGWMGSVESPMSRWHFWGMDVFCTLRELGVGDVERDRHRRLSARELGDVIRKVLDDWDRRMGGAADLA